MKSGITEDFYPITEVQMTGRGTRGTHAYKHNVSGGAMDFICQSGEKPYFEKTSVYTPHNSWDCESQWRKNDCREVSVWHANWQTNCRTTGLSAGMENVISMTSDTFWILETHKK